MQLGGLSRAVLVLVIAYVAGFLIFTLTLPRKPERVDSADGIVALTGGDARLDAAVALFEHGVGKRLLITGVHSTTTKDDLKLLAHGGLALRLLRRSGLCRPETPTATPPKRRTGRTPIIIDSSSW